VTLPDAADLAVFARERSLPNVIDFPLQDALVRFAGGSAGARAVATRLADDDYFRRPDGTAPTPATFLGNHDAGRAALLVSRQTGATGAELTARVNLGHALLFLLRGAPVVYYGDEVGMIGRGGDKAARQDMFPTQVAEWRSEPRVGSPPIGTGSSFDVDLAAHPVAARLRELGGLRTRFPALSTGGSTVRLARDAVLVVSRFDAAERHEYVALFNASETGQTASFATATPSSTWTQWLGQGSRRPTSDAAGRLSVQLQPLEAVLLRSEAPCPPAARRASPSASAPIPTPTSGFSPQVSRPPIPPPSPSPSGRRARGRGGGSPSTTARPIARISTRGTTRAAAASTPWRSCAPATAPSRPLASRRSCRDADRARRGRPGAGPAFRLSRQTVSASCLRFGSGSTRSALSTTFSAFVVAASENTS
jgi:hypothetical protein